MIRTTTTKSASNGNKIHYYSTLSTMDAIHTQLAQIRTRLDDVPALQKLEVSRLPAISLSLGIVCSGTAKSSHVQRILILNRLLLLLLINKGPNERAKRICRGRWCRIPFLPHLFRYRRWSIMQCHWIPLPRIQVIPGPGKPG